MAKQTLELFRKNGDCITTAHLLRLAHEGYYLVNGQPDLDGGKLGTTYTFVRKNPKGN